MNSEDVAHYLLNTPEFFEEHLETLAQITLAHPHGGRTISLGERQLLALREKNRVLENRFLLDLIGMHRFALLGLDAKVPDDLPLGALVEGNHELAAGWVCQRGRNGDRLG